MARTCFVLMPFAKSFDGIWGILREAVTRHGDDCVRADDIFKPGLVMADVLARIRGADYLIADLTGRNPNVYYELGYAHAIAKPVILITRDASDVPFDLRNHRIIAYADTIAGAGELGRAIARALEEV